MHNIKAFSTLLKVHIVRIWYFPSHFCKILTKRGSQWERERVNSSLETHTIIPWNSYHHPLEFPLSLSLSHTKNDIDHIFYCHSSISTCIIVAIVQTGRFLTGKARCYTCHRAARDLSPLTYNCTSAHLGFQLSNVCSAAELSDVPVRAKGARDIHGGF